jgi:phosphoglucosamine mutase
MGRLFGTDGIRGAAGVAPLDRETLNRVGCSLARHLPEEKPRILIGRDTRSSGRDLEIWLQEGIHAGGGETVSAGIITTPAIAILTRRFGFSAGMMISASHNPYPDNGVKIFSSNGNKSSDELESTIESEVEKSPPNFDLSAMPPTAPHPDLQRAYMSFLETTLTHLPRLPDLSVVLDCANGAGFEVGPAVLTKLGVAVIPMGASPDGRNINQECGSTHPEQMARRVVETSSDLGAALDGDGDRLILADHKGSIVNGDGILLMCARRLKSEDRLPGPAVVATVMSNLALEKGLESEGIELCRTQVGDKYVSEEMSRRGLPLGGEQSGHIIFREHAPTGDGLITLLQVLRVMALEDKSLAQLAHLEPFPQVLLNVRVKDKPEIDTVPEIARAVEDAERRLKDRGRVLIRYSGTEPLLRIMMEGPDGQEIQDLSHSVRTAALRTIGDS